MLFDSISKWLKRFWALISWPPLSRASPAKSKAGLDPVDASLDEAGRVGDALGLTVDHADDLGHFLDRVADLAEPRLGGAAALDTGLDL